MTQHRSPQGQSLAVLVSGGLDSAILLGNAVQEQAAVYPIYVRCGHYWEDTELRYLNRFLKVIHNGACKPLQILEIPVADIYSGHWSLTGDNVPNADSPDEAVYLPGRNVLLLAKALLWCHQHDVSIIALGALGSNPFPDATPAFFLNYQNVVNQAIHGSVEIYRPFAEISKTEVMQRGKNLPLELTFSCIRPVAELHCGRCNKCAERRRAFVDAKIVDPTQYNV